MNEESTVSAKLTRISNAVDRIRTKTESSSEESIENVATAVEALKDPTGNVDITTTSVVDVTNYATATVVDTNLVSSNIKKDVTVLGVTGSLEEGITPTGNINITDTNSTDVTNYATAQVVDANLIAGNIKKDTTILGITGSYEGGGSAKSNIYKVATLADMAEIDDMVEGDLCVVTTFSEQSVTQDFTSGTITFVSPVVMSTAVTTEKQFRSMGMSYFDGRLEPTEMMVYCDMDGDFIDIRYTSSDGITYTKVNGPDTLTLSDINFMEWDDDFGNFLKISASSFDGIFIYDGSSWTNYSIGASTVASDVLLGKKAYTNTGMVTGTRDMKKYKEWNFYLQNTEPTEKKGIWCKYDTNYRSPIDVYGTSTMFDFGFTEQDVNTGITPTYVRDCPLSITSGNSVSTQNNVYHTNISTFSYGGKSFSGLKGLYIGSKLYILYSSRGTSSLDQAFYVVDLTNFSVSSKSMPNISYGHTTSIFSTCITSDGNYIVMVLGETTNSSTKDKTFRAYRYSISGNSWSTLTLTNTTGDSYIQCRGVICDDAGNFYACIAQNSSPSTIRIVQFKGSGSTTTTTTITVNAETFPQKNMDKIVNIFTGSGYTTTNRILKVSGFEYDLSTLSESTLKTAILSFSDRISGTPGIFIGDYGCVITGSSTIYSEKIGRPYDFGRCTFPNIIMPTGSNGAILNYFYNNTLYILNSDKKVYSYDISNLKHLDGVINFQVGQAGTFCDNLLADFNCSIVNVGAFTYPRTIANVITKVYLGDGTSWKLIKDNEA